VPFLANKLEASPRKQAGEASFLGIGRLRRPNPLRNVDLCVCRSKNGHDFQGYALRGMKRQADGRAWKNWWIRYSGPF
jgi:hypothetical protein